MWCRRRISACLGEVLGGLAHDRRGGIAIKFALVAPVLLLLAGNTIDFARYLQLRNALQNAVDAASLAAAKEMSLTDITRDSLAAVAGAVVRSHVDGDAAGNGRRGGDVDVRTEVRDDPLEVDVMASRAFVSAFGRMFGLTPDRVAVRSVARIVGQPNICVLGLDPSSNGTISLEHQARVTGKNCAVYSNSTHNIGIKTKNDAVLEAEFICSAGGVQGGGRNFTPPPVVDCPTFEDPLAGRPEPEVGECDPDQATEITADTVLEPGTYCGLAIRDGARVTLADSGDGVFVIKDAPLVVEGSGALIGAAAGLYFSGDKATFTFAADSTIDLEAPRSGPLAGLLVFAARAQSSGARFQILSNDARRLVGTIYVPNGEVRVDATSPIADQSAYTAIVANKLRLYGGPHLVLNTNYDQTDVPVPEGIKGAGQPIRLVN